MASSISEGAIPFTAATRRAPSCQHARRRYDGRPVHGVRRHIMASGVTSKAPHGGIFVFFAIGTRYVCRVNPDHVCRVNPDRTEMSAVAVIALKRQAVKPSSRQEVNGQLEDAALVAA